MKKVWIFMHKLVALFAATGFAAQALAAAPASTNGGKPEVTFAHDILPFLKAHCFHCHGTPDGKNKADLTRCAEDILLAREAHFPATIADLYDPANMPDDLREAHERNDELLERIYVGRRFRNDTERLEKLFELYTKMTTAAIKVKN